MSALKRSHQVQQAQKKGDHNEMSSPAKRLKSSHGKANSTFAAILDDTPKKLKAVLTNGVQNASASKVDESRATIAVNGVNGSSAQDAIEIEEDPSDSDGDSSADEEEEVDVPHTNGVVAEVGTEDVEMVHGAEEEEEQDEAPSFADLLKARNPDIIDVSAKLPDPHAEPPHLLAAGNPFGQRMSGLSLATVLQQALKTDDKEMLEKCFHLRDTQTIKNTIQRLPSPLAADLLTRISERIHRRPGRTGGFMLWIQWTLVSHGGYLAGQPDVVKKLKTLNQVIRQRAQGLLPLIQLKGKLDLLSAQLEMRKEAVIARERAITAEAPEGVLYVDDGDDDDWSDDEPAGLIEAAQDDVVMDDDDDAEEDDFNPQPQDDSEEAEEDDDAEGGLLDLEAEETDDDEGEDDDDDDDVDLSDNSDAEEDDDDEEESEDEDEEEIKVAKPQTLNRKR